ncbi:MAG: 4-(cytidine 5'-diphospho)-2-C-methyl-D-erythritol kinase [Clostridia bacterium]|nr:4-(cytidine 5'-diphospho)-2-C-methyl-D-erythritol kinase [Clostridia bacterium]
MKSIKERANAKINLYLDVLTKREDGFHDIKTVMQSVNFGDEIIITCTPSLQSNVRLFVEGSRFLPTDMRNIAVKAAYAFMERAGISENIDITLKKRIPVAAGLAGGSSDAAAVLRALNKLHGRLFSNKALNSIASELGSDVVYCLYGKCALCEGRGEIITKLKHNAEQFLVIAIANEHVSTPAAYKELDRIYSDFDGSCDTGSLEHFNLLMDSIAVDRVNENGLFNVFETAILPMCPGAAEAKKMLTKLGATASLMSGSGPSVFGLFKTPKDARFACERMRELGFRAYYTSFVKS